MAKIIIEFILFIIYMMSSTGNRRLYDLCLRVLRKNPSRINFTILPNELIRDLYLEITLGHYGERNIPVRLVSNVKSLNILLLMMYQYQPGLLTIFDKDKARLMPGHSRYDLIDTDASIDSILDREHPIGIRIPTVMADDDDPIPEQMYLIAPQYKYTILRQNFRACALAHGYSGIFTDELINSKNILMLLFKESDLGIEFISKCEKEYPGVLTDTLMVRDGNLIHACS